MRPTQLNKIASINSDMTGFSNPFPQDNVSLVDQVPVGARKFLVYIDPGFRLGRHYVSMAETMSAACRADNVTLLHCVGQNVPDRVAEKYGLLRIFKNGSCLQAGVASSFVNDLEIALDDVTRYVGSENELSLYMYCGNISHFLGISELVCLPKYQEIKMKFFINLSYQDLNCGKSTSDYAEDLRHLSTIWDSRDISRKIVGIMDNHQSIKRYQSCFTRRLFLAPVPLYHCMPNPEIVARNQNQLTIGYFGQLVEEQGYLLATQVYEEFIEKRNQPGLKFLMRVNNQTSEKHLLKHFEKFRNKTNSITIMEGFVETDEHLRMISECDIIVLPYRKESYPCRTSGVFIDALIHNKVVVVPDETWMAEMITMHGSGSKFRSGNLTSLIEAVDSVITNYDSYSSVAARSVSAMYNQFSAASLLDLMFGNDSKSVKQFFRG